MDVLLTPILVSLAALIVVLVELLFIRLGSTNKGLTAYKVAEFIYELDDPDVLKELSILTDVRRLLLHLELTEGRQRLG